MTKPFLTVGCLLVVVSLWTWSTAGPAPQHHHDSPGGDGVVFGSFPRDAHDFQEDLRPLIDPIVKRHGVQEWQVVVLTHEFHRHLGIYSIIGAKMGLAAREHFKVGLDELKVLSRAGHRPPLSCLNDGLQVSTGATLGHGTISIAEGIPPRPTAQFTHDEHTVTLALKQVYWEQIKADIRQIIETHGLDTPEYWSAVRQLGLKYWLQWSRRDLFEVTTE